MNSVVAQQLHVQMMTGKKATRGVHVLLMFSYNLTHLLYALKQNIEGSFPLS